MPHVIAVLEDDPGRTAAMTEALRPALPFAETVFFDNAPDMITWLTTSLPGVGVLCLDHDLGPNRQRDGEDFDPGIGRDVANFLATQSPSCAVVVHSSNGPAADAMVFALQQAGWSAERVVPYDDLAWVKARWLDRVVSCVSGDLPRALDDP